MKPGIPRKRKINETGYTEIHSKKYTWNKRGGGMQRKIERKGNRKQEIARNEIR